MAKLMPPTTQHDKRLVLVHADGIEQIICVHSGETPITLTGIQTLGRSIPFASLYRVTTRAAYYKAPTVPQSFNTFHEAQK